MPPPHNVLKQASKSSIYPFIHTLCVLPYLCRVLAGGWGKLPVVIGWEVGIPCTGRQSITGKHRDKQNKQSFMQHSYLRDQLTQHSTGLWFSPKTLQINQAFDQKGECKVPAKTQKKIKEADINWSMKTKQNDHNKICNDCIQKQGWRTTAECKLSRKNCKSITPDRNQ